MENILAEGSIILSSMNFNWFLVYSIFNVCPRLTIIQIFCHMLSMLVLISTSEKLLVKKVNYSIFINFLHVFLIQFIHVMSSTLLLYEIFY